MKVLGKHIHLANAPVIMIDAKTGDVLQESTVGNHVLEMRSVLLDCEYINIEQVLKHLIKKVSEEYNKEGKEIFSHVYLLQIAPHLADTLNGNVFEARAKVRFAVY